MKLLDFILTSDVFPKVVATVIGAAIIGAFKSTYGSFRKHQLRKRLEEDHYTPAEIKEAAAKSYTYVPPDCQDNNPASPGPDVNRRPIFEEVDRLLGPPLVGRFTLILADGGMGKTTFLERYYAYHWRSTGRSTRFKTVLIPLQGPSADELMRRVDPQSRGDTVLLLDALDEDNAAIANFSDRFRDLVRIAGQFRAVVITCRTQFADPASIPEELDLPAPSIPMPLSGGPDRRVRWLYLSPLSDAQVKKYLAARFPYWRRPILRLRAARVAGVFRDLVSRPLLHTYIQEFVSNSKRPEYSFQAYRLIVENWLEREKKKNRLTIPPGNLLRFFEDFAVSLFATGRDRAPFAELQSMAERFGVGPVFREVRERSLLHNDAEGNWRFVHRSIMEYLLVNATPEAKDRPPWVGRAWTDQMRKFAGEMLMSRECKRLPWADLHGIDLNGVDLSGCDLRKANLSGANLNDCNLNATNLSDANLTEAHLLGASLDLANVRGACLERTVLAGADLAKVRGLTLLQASTAIADPATMWPVRALAGHSSAVYAVAATPDSQRAVSASDDGTLKVWDLQTGVELCTLAGHTAAVKGVAVTPDGGHAVSASNDKTLKVWDLETGAELRTLTGHSDDVRAVAVTPDGRRAVSASHDKTLKVWDLETGAELRTLAGHSAWVTTAICFRLSAAQMSVIWPGLDLLFNSYNSRQHKSGIRYEYPFRIYPPLRGFDCGAFDQEIMDEILGLWKRLRPKAKAGGRVQMDSFTSFHRGRMWTLIIDPSVSLVDLANLGRYSAMYFSARSPMVGTACTGRAAPWLMLEMAGSRCFQSAFSFGNSATENVSWCITPLIRYLHSQTSLSCR